MKLWIANFFKTWDKDRLKTLGNHLFDKLVDWFFTLVILFLFVYVYGLIITRD